MPTTRPFNRSKSWGWFASAGLFAAYIVYKILAGERVAGSTWLFFLLTAGAGLTYFLRYRALQREQSSERELPVEEGGIYSVENEDSFGVVKVLVVDDDVIHVRLYKNKFSTRPQSVEPAELLLGTVHDEDGSGIGHLPVTPELFRSWWPRLILVEPVAGEELDGYEMWREGGGGVFGAGA